jgi:hypothetical protein
VVIASPLSRKMLDIAGLSGRKAQVMNYKDGICETMRVQGEVNRLHREIVKISGEWFKFYYPELDFERRFTEIQVVSTSSREFSAGISIYEERCSNTLTGLPSIQARLPRNGFNCRSDQKERTDISIKSPQARGGRDTPRLHHPKKIYPKWHYIRCLTY